MQRISVEESVFIIKDASWKLIYSLVLCMPQFMTLTQERFKEKP